MAAEGEGLGRKPDSIFCKIAAKEDETQLIYEDEEISVFPDRKPAAKHHYLVVSKEHNFTLSRGNIPTDWKVANVVPIFKSGKNNLADNYRPISLTSVVVKTLERLIHKHIMKYLTDFQLLKDNQHGFRPSRSCVTQLLQLVHEWFQALEKLGSVDAVFLDFAKAFDKVSHAHLLYKLEGYAIKGQILS